jgi:hypothetical protein
MLTLVKDVLYLMIVNNPNDSGPSSINTSPAPKQQMSYPYREAKRIKSPQNVPGRNPSQQMWSPKEGYARDSAVESRSRSPPPAYNES